MKFIAIKFDRLLFETYAEVHLSVCRMFGLSKLRNLVLIQTKSVFTQDHKNIDEFALGTLTYKSVLIIQTGILIHLFGNLIDVSEVLGQKCLKTL